MDQEIAQQYATFRNHLVESRHQSYVQFDKAILLLAGGGLTVSLTVVKDLVKLATITWKPLLFTSWALFVLPLLMILFSFLTSIKALDRQIDLTDEYYLDGNEETLRKPNCLLKITKYLNISSAVSIVLAVTALLIFVSINFS